MSIQSEIDRINTAVSDQESLIGEIVTALAERCVVTEPILQAKTVTPTEEVQTITPDTGYDGLSSVTVEAAQGGEGTYGWKKLVSKLPSGYTEVEYIESTGAQYIDTGFTPNQDTRVVIDVETTQMTTAALFGARQGNTTATFCFFNISTTSVRSDYGTVQNTISVGSALNRVVIDKNKNVCSYGENTVTQTTSTFNCGCSLLLLTNNYQGSPTGESLTSAKVYSCQIYDNGTLVRDFIPCENASGTVGLYDIVNGVFYGNSGSGAFTAGSATNAPSATVVVGYAVSDDANTYPDGEFLDGYYYEKL